MQYNQINWRFLIVSVYLIIKIEENGFNKEKIDFQDVSVGVPKFFFKCNGVFEIPC